MRAGGLGGTQTNARSYALYFFVPGFAQHENTDIPCEL
jgi:hypothetical protein